MSSVFEKKFSRVYEKECYYSQSILFDAKANIIT